MTMGEYELIFYGKFLIYMLLFHERFFVLFFFRFIISNDEL